MILLLTDDEFERLPTSVAQSILLADFVAIKGKHGWTVTKDRGGRAPAKLDPEQLRARLKEVA